jgi:hypothetical protein
MELWNELERAGEAVDALVTGPNLSRAVEQAITDTRYFVNSGMTPYEARAGRLVDLDSAPFVGSDTLARAASERQRRHTLGLVLDAAPGRLKQFWTVEAGVGRWARCAGQRTRMRSRPTWRSRCSTPASATAGASRCAARRARSPRAPGSFRS